MAENNIGAARVHLIVDATDWDAAIAQAKGGAELFGRQAEAAFDKSSAGVRRAAGRIADYIAALKSTDGPMERQLRQLARLGADESIIKALASSWQSVTSEVRETAAAMEEAQRINAAFDQQRVLNNQQRINSLVAPGLGGSAMDNGASVSALQQMLALEQQLEAEASDINREYNRWQTQIDAIGKDFYEIQIAQARQRYGTGADPIIAQINQYKALNTTIHGTTVNTKQLQQAIRFLPAQFTDIGVSLAAGMNPLLVAFQQGGQIFDQFRLAGAGVRQTLSTLATYALRLVNPITVGAAALGTLAFAAYRAEQNTFDLQKALITTGGFAAGSVGQLEALIDTLDNLEGVTKGGARDAVLTLAQSGRFTGEQFDMVAQAAARMEAATGLAVDETVAKFRKIAEDPVDALLELNRTEHFLTQTQLDRIDALIKEGREQEAVAEALRIYAERTDQVSTAIINARPHLTQFAADFKNLASEVWEGTKNITEFLAATAKVTAQRPWWQQFGLTGAVNFLRDMSQAEPVAPADIPTVADAVDTKAAKDARKAVDDNTKAWERYVEQGLTPAAKLQNELNEIRKVGEALGKDELEILAQQEAARAKANRSGRGRDGTQAIRDAAAAETAVINTQTALLQSQYEQRQITVEDYYAKLHTFADEELSITLRSIDAQKRAVAGREDAADRLAQLDSQAARAREQAQQRSIELTGAETKAVQQREIAFRDYKLALIESNEAAQRDADLQVARITMGAQEYGRMVQVNELLRKRADMQAEIDRRVADGTLEAADAERYSEALRLVNIQLEIMQEGFARVDQAQGDFFNGTQRAWNDWLEDTANTSEEGYRIMTQGLEGFSGAITDALTGNLDTFRSFFDDLHKQILNFIVKQQLTDWMKSVQASSGSGEGGGFWASFAGALFGSPTANAKGDVYAASGLSAYRNSIVSQPTLFPFANGGIPRMGLMGERSGKPHEAIMPVTRLSGGDLGVKVVESGRRGPVTIHQPIYIQGRVDDRTTEQVAAASGREAARAMKRSGN